jgi:phosphoribosylformylglycinamidine synthase
MSAVNALVLTGFGLNCDWETKHALERAGASVEKVHLNSLIAGDVKLDRFQIFIVGGGFSWGDDHGAGVIMATRMKYRLGDEILAFIDRGGVIVGICNGFQVLVNLGVLPGFEPGKLNREVALINNDCGSFRDQWVGLTVNPASPCVLSQGVTSLDLPVRHGEGKFYAAPEIIRRLVAQNQVFLRYAGPDGAAAGGAFPFNPNGSVEDIAGICDPTGRVVGLMPHPEAFNHCTNHPDWSIRKERGRRRGETLEEEGQGIRFFRNAVRYFA